MRTYDSSYTPTEDDIAAYNADQAQAELETERAAEQKPEPAKTIKLPKPVRQSITIDLRGGPQVIDGCDVYAGVLALRKLPKSRDYNITHVPTGMSIIDYVSPKAKALECVAALLEDGVEIWKFGELGIDNNDGASMKEHLRICKRVANKAQHIAHPENWNEDGTRVR